MSLITDSVLLLSFNNISDTLKTDEDISLSLSE